MNSTTRKNSHSVTRMIRTDHEQVMTLFHRLAPDSPEADRATTMRSICALLEVHAQLEEEIFYPTLQQLGIQSPALDHAASDHEKMRGLIARVRSLDGQRLTQLDAVNELINAVLHHVADEETQVLPAAERFVSGERLIELGGRMAARRIELARPRAADMARAAPAKAALLTVGALVAGSLLLKSLRRGRSVRTPY